MNLCVLTGFTGKDAELRFTQSGQAVMNVSLATTEKWVTESGEKKEKTEWHQLVMFGKRAEAVSKYVTKGKQLSVTGSLQTRKWEDKQGVTRYTTEIKVNNLELLGGGGRGHQDDGHAGGSDPRTADDGDHQPYDDGSEIPF